MSRSVLYVDTSAFLKLLVDEEHSGAVRAAFDDAELWSSVLLDLESHRAAMRLGVDPDLVRSALDAVTLVQPSATTFATARDVGGPRLRTLDALHLAAVLELGDDLEAVVTYDDRLGAGCASVGITSLSPT